MQAITRLNSKSNNKSMIVLEEKKMRKKQPRDREEGETERERENFI